MKTIEKLLGKEKLDACHKAKEWAKGKTWEEIHNTCHRGDWLLWLFKRTNPKDVRLITLVNWHCANTVRVVDLEISFDNGGIGKGGQNADDSAASAAAISYSAAYSVAYSADDAVYSAATAKMKNQKETADICRKYLPIEIWNITFD